MLATFVRHTVAAVVACALFAPSEVSAKIALFTSGESIIPIGTAKEGPPDMRQIGFKYNYGGLFWIDFWTWDGTYCIYQDKRYKPITEAEAAQLLGKPTSALSKPFQYRVPLGLLILGVFLICMAALGALGMRRSPDRAEPKPDNPDERLG
jgi:hypothetical protein